MRRSFNLRERSTTRSERNSSFYDTMFINRITYIFYPYRKKKHYFLRIKT